MESGVLPMDPYTPRRMSGYFHAYVENTQDMYDSSAWMPTLASLHSQKGYLEGLLSKTATTLNALRDRQTRNERALSTNPTPRSKRKKIQQNRWRTNKTIQTCENEEKVILDCLQVCTSNIHTLESIINPTDLSSTAATYSSSKSYSKYADSESTDFDWYGWTDDAPISPFQKERERSLVVDEIPPEARWDEIVYETKITRELKRPPPLRPCLRAPRDEDSLPAPPNTAQTQFQHSSLSPEADVFEPSVTHTPCDGGLPKELDKLSLSGLWASKRMRLIQKRRFSDAAIGHLFRRLSSGARPELLQKRTHASWAGPSVQPRHTDPQPAGKGKGKGKMKRTKSV
ncbi:hypothetical protein BU26DRAFT_572191 [Trematosphaeria pertusa]|uniref:Uncharacterized protein n=1 Tax=Trematosphaeria pertusa TaxID=390896 RepID=A0A6A6HTU5_9PLEO|nr:uncharacterized protein BU26DRAFT_572191 [Trematosphaeria pertusa]KAF2240953.1 hypothetical protein BU26DRAFT_572191 [Trematosphaeria pertusa]